MTVTCSPDARTRRYYVWVLTTRTLISLSQYFALQDDEWIQLLFTKHGIPIPRQHYFGEDRLSSLRRIQDSLSHAEIASVESLLSEVARTQGSFRNRVAPRYVYDQRWEDVRLCLQLDGYLISERDGLRRTEPDIEGAPALEDDLTSELERSGLAEAQDVIRLLNNSAEDFRRQPADLNGALTNARIALQTLATAVSRAHTASRPTGFDESKWGQVANHLRTAGVITENEEKGLVGVFTFASPGAHTPVGLSETEMVRLGRSLVIGMCYFLVKRYNG